jgi:hypothetical protein
MTALHLDVDRLGELHETLDGAEADVRVSYQVAGARHVTADQQLQPHLPEPKLNETMARYDPRVFQHCSFWLPRRLQRLRW